MTSKINTSKTFVPDVAGVHDDPHLLKLLRENPFEGQISLSLEREPSFFLGATIEGENHHTVIVRKEDKLVGLGTRSSRDVWLNGQVTRLGYLSQLRMDSAIGSPGALRAGFKMIRELHDENDCRLYITTIIEDNLLARRLLERNWRVKPIYEKRGVLSTLVLPLSRSRKSLKSPGIEIRRGTSSDLSDIGACLRRNYAAYQFAPNWTDESLNDKNLLRDLRAENFFLAIRQGRVVGVCALWDQGGFKQTIVRGYSRNLARFRKLVNLVKPITGLPHFPPVGEQFQHLYLSHLAVDHSDRSVFLSLLYHVYAASFGRGYSYITLGLCENNPLLNIIRKAFSPMEYKSIIYLVYYKENSSLARKVEHKTPHLEVAVL